MARLSMIVAIGILSLGIAAFAQSDHERVAVQQRPGWSLLSVFDVSLQPVDGSGLAHTFDFEATWGEALILRERFEIGFSYPMRIGFAFRERRLATWSFDGSSVSSRLAVRLGSGARRGKVGIIGGMNLASPGSCCLQGVIIDRVGVVAQLSRISDPTVVAHSLSVLASLKDKSVSNVRVSPTTTFVEVLSGSLSLACAVSLPVDLHPRYRVGKPTVRIAFSRKTGDFSTGYGVETSGLGGTSVRWEVNHEWSRQ